MTNNEMTALWQIRFRHLMKEIGKYGRLIFNDHFSIIIVLILGFGGMYYQQLLVNLQHNMTHWVQWLIRLVLVLLYVVLIKMGKPIWFMNQADKSYLFARGHDFDRYWFGGMIVGMVVPIVMMVGLSLIVWPFIVMVSQWSYAQLAPFIIGLLIIKIAHNSQRFWTIYQDDKIRLSKWTQSWGNDVVSGAVVIIWLNPHANLWYSAAGVSVFIGLQVSIFLMRLQRLSSCRILFDEVLKSEAKREATFYRIIGMFADVPHQLPTIRRASSMDVLVNRLSSYFDNRYAFVYLRLLVRNDAYRGIWIRVTVFIAILMSLVSHVAVIFGLGLLGFLLVLVQLLPMTLTYAHHPIMLLYPNRASRQTACQQVMLLIFGVQGLVFILIALVRQGLNLTIIYVVFSWGIVAAVFILGYIPFWFKKRQIRE